MVKHCCSRLLALAYEIRWANTSHTYYTFLDTLTIVAGAAPLHRVGTYKMLKKRLTSENVPPPPPPSPPSLSATTIAQCAMLAVLKVHFALRLRLCQWLRRGSSVYSFSVGWLSTRFCQKSTLL